MRAVYGNLFKELDSEDGSIVYADTHDLKTIEIMFHCANMNLDHPEYRYTLVTHNSDFAVSDTYPKGLIGFPENLLWYSTNVDVDHPNIRTIPIGFENPEWHAELKKIDKLFTYPIVEKDIYCSAIFNVNTHPSRKKVMENFAAMDSCTRMSLNGYRFDSYLETLARSIYTVCPRGNGIDTHRLWEALAMGAIPIVEDCINIRQLKKAGVPLISVNCLETTTISEILKAEQDILPINPENLVMLLTIEYWMDKIRNRA